MSTKEEIAGIYVTLKAQSYALKAIKEPEATKLAEQISGIAEVLAGKYLSSGEIEALWRGLQ